MVVRPKLFMYPPLFKKTYAANKSTQTLFDGELFLGIEKPLLFDLEGQLGLAVAATSNAKLSGDIWDDADPHSTHAYCREREAFR